MIVVALLIATLCLLSNAADPKDVNKIFENPLAHGKMNFINLIGVI
jgi:hypothetical protein